jgi:ribonuclease Z
MIECSFITSGHEERAAQYRHIHFDDIAAFADRFENETIVLTHFSRRYSRSQIHDEIRRRCPAVLRDRVRLALPEPYQRL